MVSEQHPQNKSTLEVKKAKACSIKRRQKLTWVPLLKLLLGFGSLRGEEVLALLTHCIGLVFSLCDPSTTGWDKRHKSQDTSHVVLPLSHVLLHWYCLISRPVSGLHHCNTNEWRHVIRYALDTTYFTFFQRKLN